MQKRDSVVLACDWSIASKTRTHPNARPVGTTYARQLCRVKITFLNGAVGLTPHRLEVRVRTSTDDVAGVERVRSSTEHKRKKKGIVGGTTQNLFQVGDTQPQIQPMASTYTLYVSIVVPG